MSRVLEPIWDDISKRYMLRRFGLKMKKVNFDLIDDPVVKLIVKRNDTTCPTEMLVLQLLTQA